jgi:hypothetical protein
MPNRDKTGPRGEGAGTGGGRGGCVPIEERLEKKRKDDKECGVGRGLPPCGMGRGVNISNLSTEQQLENLRKRVTELEDKKSS